MNVNNYQEKGNENLENSTLNEVMNILNLSDESQEEFYEKFGDINNSDLISQILKHDDEYRANKQLAKYAIRYISSDEFKNFPPLFNDKDIALIAVGSSNINYYYLSDNLKKDVDIGKKMIISMVNQAESYESIIGFIEEKFGENSKIKNQLLDNYKKSIKKSQQIYIKDLNKCLVVLENDFPDFITDLLTKNILIKDKKSFTFSKEFYKNIEGIISTIPKEIKKIQRKNKIKEIIIQQLDIPNNIPKKYIDFLIETIEKNINIKTQSSKIEKVSQKDKEKQETNEAETNSRGEDSKYIESNNDDIDQYYPEAEYTFSGGYYHIEITQSVSLNIDETQMDQFTSVALKNFVKFYGLLYDLGLNFLWDKYQSDFVTLCNNKIGLDYTANEGISEGKSLAILNLIGKNIGVPETKLGVYDDDGNEKTQLRCFKTIADAKLVFGDIKSTGKVNGEYIMEPGTFSSYSIVEAYMLQHELIDQKRNSINLSKFK